MDEKKELPDENWELPDENQELSGHFRELIKVPAQLGHEKIKWQFSGHLPEKN